MPPTAPLEISEHTGETEDGWRLKLRRTRSPDHQRGTLPLLIVPGYGMNSFIFGFHPRGTSMERCLAEAGYDVWAVDLRQTGGSRPGHASPGETSLRSYAEHDLPAAIQSVLERSGAPQLLLIGCSLGGAIAYAYLALHGPAKLAGLCAIGAPLRWTAVNPLIRAAFSSARVAGLLKFSGTRRFAERFFPLLSRVPRALDIYMNTAHVDLSRAHEMVQTVEDPVSRVNRDISKWLRHGDLVLRGVNVTERMRDLKLPLLVVLSNRDGIVPPAAALSAREVWGGDDVEILEVGDEHDWYAHADLFLANQAPELVFAPIARWLDKRANHNS